MGKRQSIGEEMRALILNLRADGVTYQDIAARIGVSYSAARKVCMDADLAGGRTYSSYCRKRPPSHYGFGIFLLPSRASHFRYEDCIIHEKSSPRGGKHHV